MLVFPEIKKKETKKKVHHLLSNYRRLSRFASGKEKINNNDHSINSIDSRKCLARNELEKIHHAIHQLDIDKQQLLYEKYMNALFTTNIAIYMNFHMSESKFYRELDKALLCFAEAYENGELIVEE